MTAALVAVAAAACSVVVAAGLSPPWDRQRSRARRRAGLARSGRARVAPAWARRILHDAGIAEADAAWTWWTTAVCIVAAGAVVAPAARLGLAVVSIGPPLLAAASRGRGTRRRARQFPGALEAIAASLRSGAGVSAAVGHGAAVGSPLGSELAAVARQIDNGVPTVDAVAGWADARNDPDTVLTAAALTVAATVGGPGARAVDAAAASIRERQASQAELDALATQGTASAAVLTVAPLLFAMVLVTVDADVSRFLLGTPAGIGCLVGGVGLDTLGCVWMARLVRRAR